MEQEITNSLVETIINSIRILSERDTSDSTTQHLIKELRVDESFVEFVGEDIRISKMRAKLKDWKTAQGNMISVHSEENENCRQDVLNIIES